MPGISHPIPPDDAVSRPLREGPHAHHIETEVIVGIAEEIGLSQQKKSPRRSHTAAVLRMIRMKILQTEMDEGPSKLDQALMKGVVGMFPSLP